MALLEIKNLHVALEDGTEIVKGVDLAVDQNEIHAIMGPNGSGKSTLAYALMGHPAYEITEGEILFDGTDLVRARRRRARAARPVPRVPVPARGAGRDGDELPPQRDQRDPQGARGRRTIRSRSRSSARTCFAAMDRLKVSRELASRYLNDGFSGGEKKRVEILQMAMLKPKIAVLDETDSGLDIDALRIVAGGVKELVGPEMGALVITHYQRILNYVTPDFVHVFIDGRIVEEGGPSSRTSSRPRATSDTGRLQSHDADRDRRRQGNPRRRVRVRLLNPDEAKDYFFKSGRGLNARDRRGDLGAQERAGVDAEVPPPARSTTSSRGRCRSGAAT